MGGLEEDDDEDDVRSPSPSSKSPSSSASGSSSDGSSSDDDGSDGDSASGDGDDGGGKARAKARDPEWEEVCVSQTEAAHKEGMFNELQRCSSAAAASATARRARSPGR